MPSSPSQGSTKSPKRATPKTTPRTTPKRTPLQERSQSQANELIIRKTRDGKEDLDDSNVYNTTPFPTKPAHVLLPSTLRKQRSGQSSVPEFLLSNPNNSNTSLVPKSPTPTSTRKPPVRLKRSVKTLRDLYEAQGDEFKSSEYRLSGSRPSTATSIRPSSASSSRIRSVSSSDGLSGRNVWDVLSKVSSDDLALLPSLAEDAPTLRKIGSKSSFISPATKDIGTSSPNYRIFNVSSSPHQQGPDVFTDLRSPVYRDHSSPVLAPTEQISDTPKAVIRTSSSPNIIRLGQTSSVEDLGNYEDSSSPNVIKLGTSSPQHQIRIVKTTPPVSRQTSTSSTSSRKRKRDDQLETPSKLARAEFRNPFASSPPVRAFGALDSFISPSSPVGDNQTLNSGRSPSEHLEGVESSSPVIRLVNAREVDYDDSSTVETHASLQAVLSSSPPIQYPVVRAPAPSQFAGLTVAKSHSRSSYVDSLAQKLNSHRTSVHSEPSGSIPKDASKRSSYTQNPEDDPDSASFDDDIYPVRDSTNNSQVRIILEDDQHEASDEISALREPEFSFRSPNLRPTRSGSQLTSANTSQSRLNSLATSIDNRLNSIRSLTQSRQNSLLSSHQRPLSSSSAVNLVGFPAWARRYYSGFYGDAFQQLYGSTPNLLSNQHNDAFHQLYTTNSNNVLYQFHPPSRPETSISRNSRPSLVSLKDSLKESLNEHIPAIFRPRTRPQLEARKSHLSPGIGPLVSNPVRSPVTGAMPTHLRARPDQRPTIRPVSLPLHPADPRAHWAGVADMPEYQFRPRHQRSVSMDNNQSNKRLPNTPQKSWYPQPTRMNRVTSDSPHLHHDHRLNTGSSASRGYGFPFNRRSRWTAPDLSVLLFQQQHHQRDSRTSSKTDPTTRARHLRQIQILCFILGFVLPISWFTGACLPLPNRPSSFADIEKQHYTSLYLNRNQIQGNQMLEQDTNTDLFTRLRLERHVRGVEEMEWQNARWWRTLNRYMCSVGAVIIVAIVILAVLGTKGNW